MAVPHGAPAQALTGTAARVPPVALLVAGATSVQFGAALAATLFDDVGAAATAMMRLLFAAVMLIALWRPTARGLARADVRLVVAFGVALGVMNLGFYLALDRIPLGIAVTMEFAGPVAVAVALSRRRLDLLWVALAVAGIVILAEPFGTGGVDGLGLAFIMIAAVAWAAYILLAQRTAGRFRGGEGLALAAVVAALVPIVPGVVDGGRDVLDAGVLLTGACVALLSSVIPYSLETEALRRLPAHVFGVLMSLEPMVAALAGFLVLGQRLPSRDVIAIALVVAASIGATRSSRTAMALEA